MLFIHSFYFSEWNNAALFQRYSQVFHTVINSNLFFIYVFEPSTKVI